MTDRDLREMERLPEDGLSLERRDRALERAGLPTLRDGLRASLAGALRGVLVERLCQPVRWRLVLHMQLGELVPDRRGAVGDRISAMGLGPDFRAFLIANHEVKRALRRHPKSFVSIRNSKGSSILVPADAFGFEQFVHDEVLVHPVRLGPDTWRLEDDVRVDAPAWLGSIVLFARRADGTPFWSLLEQDGTGPGWF